MIAIAHSELHLSYTEIMGYPSLEFRGMTQQFTKLKRKQNESMQPKPKDEGTTLDCDLVNEDDYTKWGI